MFELPQDAQGVLPSQWIAKAIEAGGVDAGDYRIPDSSLQPASLDLRLGEVAYRLRCSFLPPRDQTVADKLTDLAMETIDLRDGAILERNRPYLIPLVERLALPETVSARANPRSSTGRLDIFTRVITDRSQAFDEIARGYHGPLYLEVFSRSFTIKVRHRLSLNQIRLVAGSPRCADEAVAAEHARTPLLYEGGAPVSAGRLEVSNGLFLSLDLSGEAGATGFRAKKNSRLLDLSAVGEHEPEDFWEPVAAERGARVVLEPEEFYLLVSQESVSVPPHLAAEMAAYDPTNGELRTHYAGFFDPGFGFDEREGLRGTRAVLEVRPHDVPFMVEHGQRVCKLGYEWMLEAPAILYGGEIGSSYQRANPMLSKHFRRAKGLDDAGLVK